MLVRTVTARSWGALGTEEAASAAASSMAGPPAAWTVRNSTPRAATERTAPATVLGMSWSLRSRKTETVAAAEFADDGGAFGDVELEADFEPAAETLELVGEGESGQSTGDVEGDDEAGVHLLQGTGWREGTGQRAQGTGSAEHRAVGTGRRAESEAHIANSGVLFGNENGVGGDFRKGERDGLRGGSILDQVVLFFAR